MSHASCQASATPSQAGSRAQACVLLPCVSALATSVCHIGLPLPGTCRRLYLVTESEAALPICRGTHGGHHGGHFPHGMAMPEDNIGKWRPLPEGVASSRDHVMANGSTEQQVGLLAQPTAQLRKQSRNSLCMVSCARYTLHPGCRHCCCCCRWLPLCLRCIHALIHVVLSRRRLPSAVRVRSAHSACHSHPSQGTVRLRS